MEFAHSILLGGDPIHARDVGYDDCKEFQIVCMVCHEPVHKCGSELTQRQYFAHYRRKEDSDCELRVLSLVRQHFDPKPMMPRGQELDKFLSRFEEIIIEGLHNNNPEFHRKFLASIDQIRNRPSYRRLIYIARQEGGLRAAINSTINLDCEVPLDFVLGVIDFLLSPNSFRALMFAVSHGLICFRYNKKVCETFADTEAVKSLSETSDREFARFIRAMTYDRNDDRVLVLKIFANSILLTASVFQSRVEVSSGGQIIQSRSL